MGSCLRQFVELGLAGYLKLTRMTNAYVLAGETQGQAAMRCGHGHEPDGLAPGEGGADAEGECRRSILERTTSAAVGARPVKLPALGRVRCVVVRYSVHYTCWLQSLASTA